MELPSHKSSSHTQIRSLFARKVTINDLRDRLLNNEPLSDDEKKAIVNFDRYRLAELNHQKSDQEFHNKYIQLQVMANLSPYEEFLQEKYH